MHFLVTKNKLKVLNKWISMSHSTVYIQFQQDKILKLITIPIMITWNVTSQLSDLFHYTYIVAYRSVCPDVRFIKPIFISFIYVFIYVIRTSAGLVANEIKRNVKRNREFDWFEDTILSFYLSENFCTELHKTSFSCYHVTDYNENRLSLNAFQ
jgi:hypothetical protein